MVQTPREPIIDGDEFQTETDLQVVPLPGTDALGAFVEQKSNIENTLGVPLAIEYAGDTMQLRLHNTDGVEEATTQNALKALKHLVHVYQNRPVREATAKTGNLKLAFNKENITKWVKEALESEAFTISFTHAADTEKSPSETIRGFAPKPQNLERIEEKLGVQCQQSGEHEYTISMSAERWNMSELPPSAQNMVMGKAMSALKLAIQKQRASFTDLGRVIEDNKIVKLKKSHFIKAETANNDNKKDAGEHDKKAENKTTQAAQATPKIEIFIGSSETPAFTKNMAAKFKRGLLTPLSQKYGVRITGETDENQQTRITISQKTEKDSLKKAENCAASLRQFFTKNVPLTRQNIEDHVDPVAPLKRQFKDHHNAFIPTAFEARLPEKILESASKNFAFEIVHVDGGYHAFALTEDGIARAKEFLDTITPKVQSQEDKARENSYSRFVEETLKSAKHYLSFANQKYQDVEDVLGDIEQSIEVKRKKIEDHQRVESEKLNAAEHAKKPETRKKAKAEAETAKKKYTQLEREIEHLRQKMQDYVRLPENLVGQYDHMLDEESAKQARLSIASDKRVQASRNVQTLEGIHNANELILSAEYKNAANELRTRIQNVSEPLLFVERLTKTKIQIENKIEALRTETEKAEKALASAEEQFKNLKKKSQTPDPWIVERQQSRLSAAQQQLEIMRAAKNVIIDNEHNILETHKSILDNFLQSLADLQLTALEAQLKAEQKELRKTETELDNKQYVGNTKRAALGDLVAKRRSLEISIKETKATIVKLKKIDTNSAQSALQANAATIDTLQNKFLEEFDASLLDTTTPNKISAKNIQVEIHDIVNKESMERVLKVAALTQKEKENWGITAKEVSKQRILHDEQEAKLAAEQERRAKTKRDFERFQKGKTPEILRIVNEISVSNLASFLGKQEDLDALYTVLNAAFSTTGIIFKPELLDTENNIWAMAIYPSNQPKKNETYLPIVKKALSQIASRFQIDAQEDDYELSDFIDEFRRHIESQSLLKGFKSEPTCAIRHPQAHEFFTTMNRAPLLQQIESAFNVKLVPGANKEKGHINVHVQNSEKGLFTHERVHQIEQLFNRIVTVQNSNKKKAERNKGKFKADQEKITDIDSQYLSRLIERTKKGELGSGGGAMAFYDPEDQKAVDTLRKTIEQQVRDELAAEAAKKLEQRELKLEKAGQKRSDRVMKICEKVIKLFEDNPFVPLTHAQKLHREVLEKNQVTIADGPAATGKTYMAVRMAVEKFISGEVDQIIIARPAVEAGGSIGFLPGDIDKKFDPYMAPIYDILDEMIGKEARITLQEQEHLKVCSIGHLRGRTINNAFIVVDEPQNMTKEQTMMVHTRLGESSFMALCGDTRQCDIPEHMSGFKPTLEMIEASKAEAPEVLKGAKIARYEDKDAKARAPYVQEIVKLFKQSADFTDLEMTIGSMDISKFIEMAEVANNKRNPDQKMAEMTVTSIFNGASEHEQVIARIALVEHFDKKVKKRLRVMFNEEAYKKADGANENTLFSEAMFKVLAEHMHSDNEALRMTAQETYRRIMDNSSDEEITDMYQYLADIA